MFRMKLVDAGPLGTPRPHATRPIPITVALPDGTQLAGWISDLKTRVVNGVLTATGTVDIPGQGSDTFTAEVQAGDTADNCLVLTLDLASLHMEPLDFVIDVPHLLVDTGAADATDRVSHLLNQLYSDPGS
jgi:hypothetical protein